MKRVSLVVGIVGLCILAVSSSACRRRAPADTGTLVQPGSIGPAPATMAPAGAIGPAPSLPPSTPPGAVGPGYYR
jgi:hypothetical protein